MRALTKPVVRKRRPRSLAGLGSPRYYHCGETFTSGRLNHVAGFGFHRRGLEAYDDLKQTLFTESAVAGEAAGYAMGLIMLGTADATSAEEMLTYARETQHEKIIRGLAIGLALIFYGRQEEADEMVKMLLAEKASGRIDMTTIQQTYQRTIDRILSFVTGCLHARPRHTPCVGCARRCQVSAAVVDRQGLYFEDIQSSTSIPLLFQRLHWGALVHQRPSTVVDEEGAGLHERKGCSCNHVVRPVGQLQVNRHDVAAAP